jgi:RNase P subunit RPR2
MMKLIKQLFCKHEYKLIRTVRYIGGSKNGLIETHMKCKKCGKWKRLCVGKGDTK